MTGAPFFRKAAGALGSAKTVGVGPIRQPA
jgi:hypothetical protein